MEHPKKSSVINSSVVTSRWFYRPSFDLIVGCGAWSLPLLLIVYAASARYPQVTTIAFYALALVFNYPHYMATIYRAYRTREDFSKYKLFTLHLALLMVLVLLFAHVSYQLLALAFTLYLTWSPFHYTGQNFGIALMFARRNGVKTTRSLRWAFYLVFLTSYAMFFLAVHSLTSSDQYILSLGIPFRAARLLWLAMMILFCAAATYSFTGFAKQVGWRRLTAPLVMLSTQVVWFVVPTSLTLFTKIDLLQARSTAGILAVMHSVQYLWITSYYARREAEAEQNNQLSVRPSWQPYRYFSLLVLGGIALFIPGPWLASRLAQVDFMSSFLAFTALVNIHHFLLDGAIWTLRDGRIASLLLNTIASKENSTTEPTRSWLKSPRRPLRLLRVAIVPLLLVIAGVDQLKFYYGAQANDAASLQRAQRLNPYDSALEVRLARAHEQSGHRAEKRAALEAAVRINPTYRAAQILLARTMIEAGEFERAYAHYKLMFSKLKPDADSLVNFGIIAEQLRHEDEAIAAWQQALENDPGQLNAHLRLAYALANQQRFKEAIPHYEQYLSLFAASQEEQAKVPLAFVGMVVLKLAKACQEAGAHDEALHFVSQAAALARKQGDKYGLSLALLQSAETKMGRAGNNEVMVDFQQALALENSGSMPNRPGDWMKFGEFLQRVKADPQFVFTCFAQAQSLLNSNTTPNDSPSRELARAVDAKLQVLESQLGKPTCQAIRNKLTAATEGVLTVKYDEMISASPVVVRAASLQLSPQK
jgi:tetratricopeptide (TPR) repeat protein